MFGTSLLLLGGNKVKYQHYFVAIAVIAAGVVIGKFVLSSFAQSAASGTSAAAAA